MASESTNSLNGILHPFLFVLEEGREIKENPLDYSLRLMHLHAKEHIRSREEVGVYPYLPATHAQAYPAISRN